MATLNILSSYRLLDHNLMAIRHQPLLSNNPQLCDYAKLKSEKEQKQKTEAEDSVCKKLSGFLGKEMVCLF